MSESRKEQRARQLRELQRQQLRDRNKLIFLVVLLAGALGIYFVSGKGEQGEPDVGPPQEIASRISLPPIGDVALDEVQDATAEDRILLEGKPYRDVLKLAQALLPAHLDALGEPALPFDELETRAGELRGQPYRLRGELLDLRTLRRPPALTEETWCWIRDDDGRDVFLACLKADEQTLEAGSFVVADGFFFKVYSQNIDGQRVEAPLLVGRSVRPSVRQMEPVTELDLALLASVEDHPLGGEGELDPKGLWHLLSFAQTVAADPERAQAAFAGVPPLDLAGLKALAQNPDAYRGVPFVIPGRVPQKPRYTGSEPAGENPIRAHRRHFAWLGNPLVFGQQPIYMLAGDDFQFEEEGARLFSGFFLQLMGYLDNEDSWRRAPVFVIVDDRPAPRGGPSIFSEFIWWFLGSACVLAGVVTWLARRDRAQAETASLALRERRRQRRQGAAGDA